MDTPHIRDMMRIAREDSVYAMQKSVAEHIEKKNRSEERFGQDATNAMNESRQKHIQEQVDVPSLDDDSPYEWITSGILGGWQRSGKIDPDKMYDPNQSRNMRSGPPGILYVNQLGMPKNTLYASRRNSHNDSHWLEAWKQAKMLDLSEKDVGQYANGVSFDLNPKARHLTINNLDDWYGLLKKYPLTVNAPKDSEYEEDPDFRLLPNWDNISKDYDSMYMSPEFVMWLKAIRDKKHGAKEINRTREINPRSFTTDSGKKGKTANLDVEGADHMFIFHPEAILRQKPYKYNDIAKPTKMDYAQKGKDSYSMREFRNKAGDNSISF